MARGQRSTGSMQVMSRGHSAPAAVDAVCRALAAQPVGAVIHYELDERIEQEAEISSPELARATGLGWVWTLGGPGDDPLSVQAPETAEDAAVSQALSAWAQSAVGRGDLRFVRERHVPVAATRIAVRDITDPAAVRVRLAGSHAALHASE